MRRGNRQRGRHGAAKGLGSRRGGLGMVGTMLASGLGAPLLPSGRVDAGPVPEVVRGLPGGRLAGRWALGVHQVDLLEREALGLVDEEVDKGDADKAAGEPDEEDLGLQVGVAGAVVDQVRGRVSDGPVEKPLSFEQS